MIKDSLYDISQVLCFETSNCNTPIYIVEPSAMMIYTGSRMLDQ